MKAMDQAFGHNSFKDIMGNIFNNGKSEKSHAGTAQETTRKSSGTVGNVLKDAEGEKSYARTAKETARKYRDALGNIIQGGQGKDSKGTSRESSNSWDWSRALSPGSWSKNLFNSTHAESMTSETHVENGKVVTRTKSCKDGKCRTEERKEDLPTSPG